MNSEYQTPPPLIQTLVYQHKLIKDSIHERWFVHIADPRVEPVCLKSWDEILSSYVRVC